MSPSHPGAKAPQIINMPPLVITARKPAPGELFGRSEVVRIRDGGYRFFTSWKLANEKLALRVKGQKQEFPLVKKTVWQCAFNSGGLDQFLKHLSTHSLWSTLTRPAIDCELIARSAGKASIASVSVEPPVAPLTCKLGAKNAGVIGKSQPMQYVGTGKAPFIGRILHKPIHGMYFFKYGGKLTTSVHERGFDCITFAGSVFGAQSHMDARGDKLAKHLKAKTVKDVPDDSVPGVVYKYFQDEETAKTDHLLWWGGHVVVVHDKQVHEFTPKASNGHRQTPILEWLAQSSRNKLKFCLRKDPQTVSS